MWCLSRMLLMMQVKFVVSCWMQLQRLTENTWIVQRRRRTAVSQQLPVATRCIRPFWQRSTQSWCSSSEEHRLHQSSVVGPSSFLRRSSRQPQRQQHRRFTRRIGRSLTDIISRLLLLMTATTTSCRDWATRRRLRPSLTLPRPRESRYQLQTQSDIVRTRRMLDLRFVMNYIFAATHLINSVECLLEFSQNQSGKYLVLQHCRLVTLRCPARSESDDFFTLVYGKWAISKVSHMKDSI